MTHQDSPGTDPLLVDLGGTVKLLLEDVSHLPEAGHGPPARLQLTGARHAVALTLHPHVILQDLQ